MAAGRDEIVALVRAAPELSGLAAEEIRLTELGGSTNRNLLVSTPRGEFVLRLPGRDPAGYVKRDSELQAARVAARLGLGAEVVHTDESSGAVLTRCIEGVQPLTGGGVRETPALIRQVGSLFRTLHHSDAVFTRRFDVFAVMEQYGARRAAAGEGAPLWSARVSSALQGARAALARAPLREVPSHGDPVPSNILDDGARLWLIDWEYACMADPAWDLGYFALESGLDELGLAALLEGYGHPAPPAWRVRAHRLTAACLGVLWHAVRAGETRRAEAGWAAEQARVAEALAMQGGTVP